MRCPQTVQNAFFCCEKHNSPSLFSLHACTKESHLKLCFCLQMAPGALGLLDLGLPNPWAAYSQSIINRQIFGLNGEILFQSSAALAFCSQDQAPKSCRQMAVKPKIFSVTAENQEEKIVQFKRKTNLITSVDEIGSDTQHM